MAKGTLVYVHGAGRQPPAKAFKDENDRLLFGNPVAFTRAAYYAHVRWPPPGGPQGAGATTRARRQRAVARAASPDVSPEEAADQIVRATLAPRPGGRPGATGGQTVAPEEREAAQELAERLFRHADRVSRGSSTRRRRLGAGPSFPDSIFRRVVGFFASDVIDYLYGGFAERMRQPVREALAKQPAPTVIVAHSLGTIITYDVLSEPAFRSLKAVLVTLGSPLGIENVQNRLRDRAGRPNPVPKGLREWGNFADRFDPVALDATLRDAFTPPKDFAVDEAVNNQTRSNHDLTGYLSIAVVGSLVRDAVEA